MHINIIMKEPLKLLKGLADETRLEILKYLIDGEKCVGDIVNHVKKSQPTVSIQLAKLESFGIVESRKDGKNVYYKISNPKIKMILSKLDYL